MSEERNSGQAAGRAGPRLRARGLSADEVADAAGKLGSIVTEKKTEAARRNLAALKAAGVVGGRKRRPLLSFACTCGEPGRVEGHKTVCPRGLAVWRRLRSGDDPNGLRAELAAGAADGGEA